jgi:Nickel responsive protein SCO4226-like
MTMFLVERLFHVSEDQMPMVGRRSRQIIEENFPEITWHHTHVVVDDGGNVRTYCVYEAPTEAVVRSHAEMLGLHDVNGVYEIAGDVTPNDFPLN